MHIFMSCLKRFVFLWSSTQHKTPVEKIVYWHTTNTNLTHISLAPFYGTSAYSAEPDQTPQIAASDQVLHTVCLQNVLLDLE